jgi:CheY-like chemotaxis protein
MQDVECYRLHVLVVDDEPGIRSFIALALRGEGYRVSTAENGARALDRIAEEPPAVVLLDLQMPVMDGWELRRRLSVQHPGLQVVIMSAIPRGQVGLEVGDRDGYLAKPFSLDALLQTVGRFENSESGRPQARVGQAARPNARDSRTGR